MTDKNKIISDFEPYFKDGILSLKLPHEWSDNNVLFSATALFILDKLGISNKIFFNIQRGKLLDTLQRDQKIIRGLYNPFKSWDVDENNNGSFSHDETLGLGMLSKIFASDLVYYGQRNLWVFNNRGLIKDIPIQWMGRFPTLIAYLYSRAGKIPFHPFCHLYAIGEFLFADRYDTKKYFGTPKDPTSGKCRRFIMADHFYKNGFFPMRWAAKKYLMFLEKYYGDVSGLYKVYFLPHHPLATSTVGMRFYE